MKRRTAHLIFGLVIVASLALQLFLSLTTSTVPYDAFFLFREVEAIQQTQLPFLQDELSYGGRSHVVSLIFPYFATLVALAFGTSSLLVVLQPIFFVLLLFLLYLAAYKLYERRWIAVLLTVFMATSTLLVATYSQAPSASHLFLVFYLGVIYAFSKLPDKKASGSIAIFAILATLTSPYVLVLAGGMLVYLLLLYLEGMQQRTRELETIGFSFVFIIWYHLLAYRSLLETYGAQALWESIPREFLITTFQSLNLPLFVQLIGIVPLLLGMYGMYEVLFVKRKRSILFVAALTLVSAIFLFSGLLPLAQGLALTALHFIILAGYGLERIIHFLNKTTISRARTVLFAGLTLLSIALFIPFMFTLQEPEGITLEQENFLSSLDLPENAVILGHIEEGQALSYYTERKNYYDTTFILAPNPQQRVDDARQLFLARSSAPIISLTDYYRITHIYVSPLLRETYEQRTFFFEEDECFRLVAQNQNQEVYEVQCTRT